MSRRFPAVTAREVVRILATLIPMHAGTILKRKTFKAILRDAGISIEEFRRLRETV